MENRKKLYSVDLAFIILFLFLVLASSTASAGQTTRLTTNGMSIEPTIHSNIITWTDNTSGLGIVHMYDVNTKKDTQITSSKAYYPTNRLKKIVWVDERTSKPSLLVFDTETGSSYHITENINLSYGIPRCSVDYVVWCGNDANVYMYNLVTKKLTQVTTSGTAANPASCCNNKVVYQDRRSGKWNIYKYSILSGNEIKVTTSDSAYRPWTCGDRIVYQDFRNGGPDVYLYDLDTNKETRISNSGQAWNPVISYKKMVWEDFRNGNPAVYFYDLDTSRETLITAAKADQYYPTISEDKIVWQDLHSTVDGNQSDIYVYDLAANPTTPHSAFRTNVTSGNAPLTVSFTDESAGSPTSWSWNFGDKSTSLAQHPVHTYLMAGNYTVNLTVSNENGVSSKLATINVSSSSSLPLLPGYANPPTDPNHDGRYEDMNGNGIQDFDDVVAYYDNMDWIEENAPVDLFDYNNNNLVDFDDAVRLYDLL
jgi:beta propeller repeat protein